jgi:hypothetical protein
MKVQSTALKREVDEDETPDVPETSLPENDADSEAGGPPAPPPAPPSSSAASSSDSEEPAPVADAQLGATTVPTEAANTKNIETNPKRPLTASE